MSTAMVIAGRSVHLTTLFFYLYNMNLSTDTFDLWLMEDILNILLYSILSGLIICYPITRDERQLGQT